jgi:hypothetical protein
MTGRRFATNACQPGGTAGLTNPDVAFDFIDFLLAATTSPT